MDQLTTPVMNSGARLIGSGPTISYQPRPVQQIPWSQRINYRIIIFSVIMLALIGIPIYMWLSAIVSGGVVDRGAYKEVNLKAMSLFDMDQTNGTMADIPTKFRGLDGQRVMMIGEMWAPKSASADNLASFQLCYSISSCCFNGPPLAQHFVDGQVVPGRKVYYYVSPVKVWGTLHVYVHKDEGGVIKSIYHVDVDKVEPYEG